MAAVLARSQIDVEEYLDLVFDDRPEPDYVDGEVVERALPTPIHGQIQVLLGIFVCALVDSRPIDSDVGTPCADSAEALSSYRFYCLSRCAPGGPLRNNTRVRGD